MSAEAWSQLNQLHLYLGGPRARERLHSSPFRFFDKVRRACLLFVALVDGTLSRGEEFSFIQLGRSLERADVTARIVQGGFADDGPAWDSLLRVCSAHEAYIQRYQDRVEPEGVIDVLVLASDFPRSVRYRVARCLEALAGLAAADPVTLAEHPRSAGSAGWMATCDTRMRSKFAAGGRRRSSAAFSTKWPVPAPKSRIRIFSPDGRTGSCCCGSITKPD